MDKTSESGVCKEAFRARGRRGTRPLGRGALSTAWLCKAMGSGRGEVERGGGEKGCRGPAGAPPVPARIPGEAAALPPPWGRGARQTVADRPPGSAWW